MDESQELKKSIPHEIDKIQLVKSEDGSVSLPDELKEDVKGKKIHEEMKEELPVESPAQIQHADPSGQKESKEEEKTEVIITQEQQNPQEKIEEVKDIKGPPEQEAKEETKQQAKEQAIEEAKKQVTEEPKLQATEEPKEQAIEEVKKQVPEKPKEQATEEPKKQVIEEAKVQAVEEPKVQAAEDPKVQAAEEPKAQAAEEPKAQAAEEPMVQAAEEAKADSEISLVTEPAKSSQEESSSIPFIWIAAPIGGALLAAVAVGIFYLKNKK